MVILTVSIIKTELSKLSRLGNHLDKWINIYDKDLKSFYRNYEEMVANKLSTCYKRQLKPSSRQ